jgi:hypothetical protein
MKSIHVIRFEGLYYSFCGSKNCVKNYHITGVSVVKFTPTSMTWGGGVLV